MPDQTCTHIEAISTVKHPQQRQSIGPCMPLDRDSDLEQLNVWTSNRHKLPPALVQTYPAVSSNRIARCSALVSFRLLFIVMARNTFAAPSLLGTLACQHYSGVQV